MGWNVPRTGLPDPPLSSTPVRVYCEEIAVIPWGRIVEELPIVALLMRRQRSQVAPGWLQCLGVMADGLHVGSVCVVPAGTAVA